MRCYTTQHKFYCGIDLHARSLYVGIVSQDGAILLHRTRQAAPAPFLKAVAPYRDGVVVAVECLYPWDWLADLWADEDIPFVLGHALSMKAMHGGKATNDKSAAHKSAALLRGGMLPQASGSPAARRATRALRRRRTHLMRTRAALVAHVPNPKSPYNLPEIGTKIAYKAKRDGVAARCAAAAVHQTIEVDLALITCDDERLTDLALSLLKTAKHHDAHTLYRLPTVPGLGKILSLGLLSALHRIDRFPSGQAFAAYARRVPCSKASGGKRLGTSGTKSAPRPSRGPLPKRPL